MKTLIKSLKIAAKEELKKRIAQEVKTFLLTGFSEDEIACKFGEISICSETDEYVSWIIEKISE